MPSEVQNPHAGRTLSHFVFLARHTWQALELLLRGYRAPGEATAGRFLDVLGGSRPASGPPGVVGLCAGMPQIAVALGPSAIGDPDHDPGSNYGGY